MKNSIIKTIKEPRITEKGSVLAEHNIYTFNVDDSANKQEISKAVFLLYKVKPTKINILPIPKKTVFMRGKSGQKGGGKKALVYLKKGDKIELV